MDGDLMTTPTWQIESLRKTFFFPPGEALHELGLWRAITGADPADQTTKPLLRTSTETGEWNDYTLTVSTQPGRVDLILTPPATATDLPNLGTYHERVTEFNALNLPEGLPRVIRLAFGAVALAPCNSHAECYTSLGQIIKHVEISPDSREFLYRINNPSTSTACNGFNLNCISTWGAIKVVLVRMADLTTTEEIKYAIRAELDLSTDAESDLPIDANISELVTEFTSIGQSILNEGPAP